MDEFVPLTAESCKSCADHALQDRCLVQASIPASPASPSSVALSSTRFATPFDLCAFVDDLPADAAGELLVRTPTSDVVGTLFVQGNRVCWAAARGLARYLTELLVSRAKIDPILMDRHFRRCRDQGVPLGEDLVARGIVTSDDLRASLLEHSAASLRALCTSGEVAATWRSSVRGYSPRFTFATSELVTVTASALDDSASAGARLLATHFSPAEGDWAAAFVRRPEIAFPVPIAVVGAFPERASALLGWGRWSASTFDVACTFSDDGATVVVSPTADGERAVVVFRTAAHVVVGEIGRAAVGRLLRDRHGERRTGEGTPWAQ